MNIQRHIERRAEARLRQVLERHGEVVSLVCREAFAGDEYHEQALMRRIVERLWNGMPTLPGAVVDWRRWVWRVSLNERASYLRSKEFRDGQRLSRLEAWMAERPEEERDEQRLRLEELIARLEPQERELIELYLEGLKGEEMAQRMGWSLATVNRRLQAIKLKLKEMHEYETH